MKTLLALAIVLGLLGTAGGAAMLVRHSQERNAPVAFSGKPAPQASAATLDQPTLDPAAHQKPTQKHERQADRRPSIHSRLHPPHHKRQPGDDSADALNRRELR